MFARCSVRLQQPSYNYSAREVAFVYFDTANTCHQLFSSIFSNCFCLQEKRSGAFLANLKVFAERSWDILCQLLIKRSSTVLYIARWCLFFKILHVSHYIFCSLFHELLFSFSGLLFCMINRSSSRCCLLSACTALVSQDFLTISGCFFWSGYTLGARLMVAGI